ncbi:hypothetical protein F4819DRAFT_320940 [Hypoxylon fuscum]|nr:hypothetical protein F4819DRAFT_320940 [Hypoxylon fuscum]
MGSIGLLDVCTLACGNTWAELDSRGSQMSWTVSSRRISRVIPQYLVSKFVIPTSATEILPCFQFLPRVVNFYLVSKTSDQRNLSVLKRKPSNLRRYMNWTANTKIAFGSVTNYLIQH